VIQRVITQFPGELSLTEGSSPRTHGFSTLVLLHVGCITPANADLDPATKQTPANRYQS